MDNNFTDGYYNKVNEKDNEEIGVLSSQKADSSLIKENLDDKDQVRNTQSHTKKEENVAENVEGVNNTKDNNGLNSKTNSEDSPINNRIEINSQFPTSNIHDISALENDDEIDNNEDGRIKRPQHISSEPSTPDELIEDWERLHQAKLPKQARDFALLVAAIHLDKDDSRGV